MNKKNVTAPVGGESKQLLDLHVSAPTLRVLIALLPLAGCLLIVGLRNLNFQVYRFLFTEDGLFEYLSSAFYLGTVVVAFLICLGLKRSKRYFLAAAYLLFAVTAFIVAAEEISWGQRLLGIETPQAILEINTQQELTIHNLEPIQRKLHFAYVLVGAYGGFVWLLALPKIVQLRAFLTPYVAPRWYLATYFLPVFLLYGHLETATRETALFHYRSPDQEPAEFILSLGFLLFVVTNRYRQVSDFSLDRYQLFINIFWATDKTDNLKT